MLCKLTLFVDCDEILLDDEIFWIIHRMSFTLYDYKKFPNDNDDKAVP